MTNEQMAVLLSGWEKHFHECCNYSQQRMMDKGLNDKDARDALIPFINYMCSISEQIDILSGVPREAFHKKRLLDEEIKRRENHLKKGSV